VQIIPNPANEKIVVSANALHGNKAEIKITGITGNELLSKKFISVSSGAFSATLNTVELSAGIYFVTIQTDKETLMGKFVKE
jgi:hypothetical protein